MHLQPSLKTLNLRRYLSRLGQGIPIQDQENRPEAPVHQPIPKAANHTGVKLSRLDHKPHLPAPIRGTKKIQRIRRTRIAHHRFFSLSPPCRPRVIIASKSRFGAKPSFRSQLPRSLRHGRVLFLNPFPHPLRVLRIGPPQRLLGNWLYSKTLAAGGW
jgi:hypothetical protein